MQKFSLALSLVLALLAFGIYTPDATARPDYFSTYCTVCHPSFSASCDACHAHGVHSSSAMNDINLTGTTNKTTYAPGETVSVTITGGYGTGGAVRTVLYNQANEPIAQGTGAGYPVTLSAPAPATAGTYAWKAAWYGNKFDLTEAGVGTTHFGAGWTPDPIAIDHGAEIVTIYPFLVTPASGPSINVTPSSLDFGQVTQGGTVTKTSQIRNVGTATLNVTGITFGSGTSSEYSSSPAAPFTVAAGGTTTLSVTYAPIDLTVDSGSLLIASNDAGKPTVTLNVTGTGVAPQVQPIDIDITRLTAINNIRLSKVKPVAPVLDVSNPGMLSSGTSLVSATLVGVENSVQIYNQTIALNNIAAGSTASFTFPAYTPTTLGTIYWTVTVNDQDPDTDLMTAITTVTR